MFQGVLNMNDSGENLKEFKSSALPLSSLVNKLSSTNVIFSFDFNFSDKKRLIVSSI